MIVTFSSTIFIFFVLIRNPIWPPHKAEYFYQIKILEQKETNKKIFEIVSDLENIIGPSRHCKENKKKTC
jgi:hypothetical protein